MHLPAVIGHPGLHDVVPAAVVHIAVSLPQTLVVPLRLCARMGQIGGKGLPEFLNLARHKLYGRHVPVYMGHPLEPADIGAQLQIIGVQIAVAVRLDVPGMLPVILIHKGDLGAVLVPDPGLARELPHQPLVPTGDEHIVRIQLQGALPLFLYIQPVQIGILREPAVAVLMGVAPAVGALVVEMRADAAVPGVLGHAHRAHLEASVLPCPEAVLGGGLQPAPVVRPLGAGGVAGLSRAEGEERPDFIQDLRVIGGLPLPGNGFRVSHHQWLALPQEPQIPVSAGTVQILVHAAQHRKGGRAGREIHHKRHLGRADAVPPGLIQPLQQRHIGVPPDTGAIGGVEHQHIHPRIGKVLGVLPDYIWVVIPIEAVEGLVPVHQVIVRPNRMPYVELRLRGPLQYLSQVPGNRPAVCALAVAPCPVEQAHQLTFRPARLLMPRQLPAQHVRGHQQVIAGIPEMPHRCLLRPGAGALLGQFEAVEIAVLPAGEREVMYTRPNLRHLRPDALQLVEISRSGNHRRHCPVHRYVHVKDAPVHGLIPDPHPADRLLQGHLFKCDRASALLRAPFRLQHLHRCRLLLI